MVQPAIKVEGGVKFSGGSYIGGGSGPSGGGSGTAGVNGSVGYLEIDGPVIAGQQIEDPTATVNDPTGFTINDDSKTGVAMDTLSASNQAFFASYGVGIKTVTWGPGSTVASGTVNVIAIGGSTIVFFIQGQSGPATYNYPFTFS